MMNWLKRANRFIDNLYWSNVSEHRKDPDATDGRSHPCVNCLEQPTWGALPCSVCQEKLNLWCPCGTIAAYEIGTIRQPIPGYIVSEICCRCGYRIKSICDAMDQNEDSAVEQIINSMRNQKS